MKMTPAGALTHQAQTRPKSAAFVFDDKVMDPRAACGRSRSACVWTGGARRRTGRSLALHMTNRPEMVAAYYACFKLGVIAAPLRTAFKFAELATICVVIFMALLN
jgi:long-chain acyl-CoA synthetase